MSICNHFCSFQVNYLAVDIFKELALRPILPSSRDVSLSIYISVCPLPMRFSKNWLLGRFFHRVAMSVAGYIYIYVPFPCNFFQGLSLALRSHDQIPASHWWTPQNCFKDVGGNLFQRFWKKIVSKIFEEICFKDFWGKFVQRFWGIFVSNILEVNSFKDFGGV